jgi:hypothetical protein
VKIEEVVVRFSLLLAGCMFFFGLALGPGAEAATVLKLDTRAMTERAQRVLHGVVRSRRVGRLGSGPQIYTEIELELIESWKGDDAPGTRVRFRQFGGRLADRGYAIAGAARFAVGEEVVVFLDRARSAHGCAFTIGLAQGKYRVATADAFGRRALSRSLDRLDFVEPGSGAPSHDAPKGPSRLSDLRAAVERSLGGARGGR